MDDVAVTVTIRDGIRHYDFKGVVGDEALFESIRRIWSEPGYDPEIPEIYDMRKLESDHVTPSGVIAVTRLNKKMHADTKPVRTALLVGSHLAFGMARMGQSYLHDDRGENMRIFRDEPEALAWIRGAN